MNNEENKDIEKAISLIKNSKDICLISHINPDGDSLGSLLALGLSLRKISGHNIKLIRSDEEVPKRLRFLPFINELEYAKENEKFDLLITLDCGDEKRLGKDALLLKNSNAVINIDHHITNTHFGNINIIDKNASSTGEIVFNLLSLLGVTIDVEIATCLYVAISTDTGSFKYDNTSASTHITVSQLLEYNIDINTITLELYQSRSFEQTKLMIESLNTLELYMDNKLAVGMVTNEMFERCKGSFQDADVIIDFIRDIENVEVACIIKQINDSEFKVGLRSKKYVDVSQIANKFNGGGHKRAAGCTITGSIKDIKIKIIEEIQKAFR